MTDNYATSPHRPQAELTGTIADVLGTYCEETNIWHLTLLFSDGEYMALSPCLQDAINRLLGCRINKWPGRKLCIAISEGESDTPEF